MQKNFMIPRKYEYKPNLSKRDAQAASFHVQSVDSSIYLLAYIGDALDDGGHQIHANLT